VHSKIDSEIIGEAIRVVMRLSPPITGNVTLESDGKILKLHSVAELSRCTVLLPCEVKGKALFAVPTEALRDATKGRKEIELEYDKTMLKIKAGRYSTALITSDAIEIDNDEKVEGKKWDVTVEQLTWLKTAVAAVALKATANMTTFMPVSVRLTSKSAFVSCYDNNRMSFTSTKEITGDLDVTLPLDTLSAVLDTFNKVACEMVVTPASLIVRNPILDVVLALPATDEDSAISTEMVREKAMSASSTDGLTVEVEKKAVTSFLDNARSVATKERSELSVKTEKGKIVLTVKTTNGTSRVALKAAVKTESAFAVDFEFFDEIVRKCPDSLSFKFVDDQHAFIMIRTTTARSLIALNQEQ
jgi:DNA polymerase III sliding clamp (beta) subunit (PCNA family)